MKKNANLFLPFLYIAIGCSLATTLASLFFNVRLFYIFAAVTAASSALLIWQMWTVKRSINGFLTRMGHALTEVQQEAMDAFPMPVFVCDELGEVLWYNRRAQDDVLEGEPCFSASVYSITGGIELSSPDVSSKGHECEYRGKCYTVYLSKAITAEQSMYLFYFVDNTTLKRHAQEYFDSRPSILLILVDNYEELQQTMEDNERTRMMGQIEYTVSKYITDNGGLMLKTDRDRFTAVVEERNLRGIISSRFPLIEQIREIQNEARLSATLSIGVGRDAANLAESQQFARQALDMALGRGGDQVAVRAAGGYEFFGGVSGGMEKRTKVKTRIVANALSELITSSDNVLVMGHRNADLDCFGASVGILRACILLGKQAHLVIRKNHNLVGGLYEKLWNSGFEGLFIEPEMAMQHVSKKTLLVVCDTHIRQFLESEQLYSQCRSVVVIDHHRKMVGHIDNAVIFYHEPFASSASEMVAELVQYFGDRLRLGRPEAEALLAGIMLDTKNFVMKTGVRTFEAAAFLRKVGADTVEVKRLFASSMISYQRKVQLVAGAEVYKGCAIAVSDEKDAADIQVTAAQAADELLNIEGVVASFLVFDAGGQISFSARSMGLLNVQLIMEKLGGGGHLTMAGAQITGITLEEGRRRLGDAIDKFLMENERK